MKNKVLSYENFRESRLNEGFLDSVLRFFKGIFDLFNDKKVKKESSEMTNYFKDMVDDEEIEDEELEDEIEVKKIKRASIRFVEAIQDRIEVDEEKGISTYQGLIKSFSSWIAMMLAYQESLKLNFLEKLLNNTEYSKRFIFVPYDERDDIAEWYKSAEKIDLSSRKSWLTLLKSEPAKRENAVKEFAKNFILFSVDENYEDGQRMLKTNDKEFIQEIYEGLAIMTGGIIEAMNQMLKNTSDDKIAEAIAKKLVEEREEGAPQERSRKAKPDDDSEEDKDTKPKSKPIKGEDKPSSRVRKTSPKNNSGL